jgi:hypothetical protein
MSRPKLLTGLAAYALLVLAASFTLSGRMLWAVWVLLGGLALKTLIAAQQLRTQHATQTGQRRGADEVNPHEQENR